MHTIQGVLPVVQLPYQDDFSIDEQTFLEEIHWLFENGVEGIVMGMVTEVLRLTDQERDRVVALMVRGANGRGPVVSSVGAESIQQAIRHARAAEEAGAHAHMAVPPALTRCSGSEVKRYYQELLAATTQPIIVQDASGYVGQAIPTVIQAELFQEYPDRIMFKPEAQPIGPNLSLLRDATGGRAAIFEGTGGIALVDSYKRGIAGTMPGSDLICFVMKLWKALERGDAAQVRLIQGPLTSIIALQNTLDSFLAIEKLLLCEQGIFKNTLVRGPVGYTIDPETRAEVLQLFAYLREVCG